jgi:class 3 adenylate cyclase/tetratricopeptide (TPR) repeat protein
VIACSQCGHSNPQGARFCNECGAALRAAEAARREERKVVSVLFADLVGFTSRAERLDPEDVRGLLAPYYARLRLELEQYGGTVEKFIGDAVMALFGAPTTHEDDPERAVRAALAIRDWVTDEQSGLQVRIGVTTGEALIALDARPGHGEGMASGDVVNTAARLQAVAPVNGILVDRTSYRATGPAIEYRAAEAVLVKGKAEPIEVWEPVQARSRFGVDVIQSGAPLVGRERELDLLRGTLARVGEERSSHLMTLIGEPGIGKSRLVYELFRAVEQDAGFTIWRQGRSLPYGEGVTLWALAEIVKAHAGILETDAADVAAAKLAAAVAKAIPVDQDARWVERHLRPLVGLAADGARGGEGRIEAFAAWRRLFEAIAEQYPVVLVFEDLHWADDDLLAFIDYMVEWVAGVPLLVLCTARPELVERRPSWGGGKRNASTLSLAPLSDADTATLIGLLGDRPAMSSDTRAALLARTGGNPLYAEHYMRMLAERGLDEGLPETVQGIIAARLDVLAAEEKRLLQDAAVVGKVFWTGALESLGGIDRATAEQRLHALERKDFVRQARRTSAADEVEYAFRHLLIRDVAYGQIPRAERADKHRLAAEWIESMGRPDDHAEMLSYHYSAAIDYGRAAGRDTTGLDRRAAVVLMGAGDRAATLNAFGAAARFYSQTLDLVPADDPERGRLLHRCGRARWLDEAGGLDLLAQAVDRLGAAGETEEAAEAESLLGQALWLQGDRDAAIRHEDAAVALLAPRPPTRAKAHVLGMRARAAVIGHEPQALALAGDVLAMTEQLGLDELRAQALQTLGMARFLAGDRGGDLEIEQSIEVARAINAPQPICDGYNNLGAQQWPRADLERAAALVATSRDEAERFGLLFSVRWADASQAAIQYMLGNWREAERLADRFVADTRDAGHYNEPFVRYVRARLRLAGGDVPGALEESGYGLDLGRRSKDPQVLAPVLAARARILAATDGEGAGTLVDELGAMPHPLPGFMDTIDVAWALHDLGRGHELAALAARASPLNAWVAPALAIVAGEFTRAADMLRASGSTTEVAYARLRGGEALWAAGAGGRGAGAARAGGGVLPRGRGDGVRGRGGGAARGAGVDPRRVERTARGGGGWIGLHRGNRGRDRRCLDLRRPEPGGA